MQDKEFDQLFKDRFEEAEITPSADLWNNINEKLTVKPKRIFPVYWIAIAAAITAAVTFGLLFHKTEKVQLTNTAAITSAAKTDEPIASKNEAAQENDVLPSADLKESFHTANVKVLPAGITKRTENKAKAENYVADQFNAKKDLMAMQPSQHVSHLDTKEATLKQEKINFQIAHPVPAEEIMIANADVSPSVDKQESKDEAVIESKQQESKGIRNIGDLVNYVVDKVDKREEKFIKFKTDEDDNSSIVGLNIGMFKFNQKKHK